MSDPHNAPMPTKAAGQEWPFPPSHLKPPSGGSGGLTEGTTSSATTEAAEHAAPAKRGRGRPKGPPTAKKLHVCLDAPSWQSLQMVADVLRVYGKVGTISEAIRFSADIAARTLAPHTTLLRADDVTARTTKLMREAAEATRP